MTTKAGQATPVLYAHEVDEYRAAIEQEVRDDIRARVEATGLARMLKEPLPWDGHQQKLALRAMQEVAAISRHESATEDGERDTEGDMIWTWTRRCCDGALTHAPDCAEPATEDGERPGLREALGDLAREWEADAARRKAIPPTRAHEAANLLAIGIDKAHAGAIRAALTTPTPDDRDREVERIAETLRLLEARAPGGSDYSFKDDAEFLYDHGLRASGGTAE